MVDLSKKSGPFEENSSAEIRSDGENSTFHPERCEENGSDRNLSEKSSDLILTFVAGTSDMITVTESNLESKEKGKMELQIV